MYFHNFRIRPSFFCIVLVVFSLIVCQSETQFVLITFNIYQNGDSFTVPYNKSLLAQPTNYAYFIHSGTINHGEFYVKHNVVETVVDKSQVQIKFQIQGLTTMDMTQLLTVKMLISGYSGGIFSLNMISTIASSPAMIQLPVIYNPAAVIKDLQVKVFILNIPMTYTQTLNTTHLSIMPLTTPSNLISKISFSVMIITRQFVSYNVGLLIDNVKLGALNLIIVFNNDSFFDPSDNTMLIGITSYAATTVPVLSIQNDVDYNFSFPIVPDHRSIFVIYQIDTLPQPSAFTTSIFIFSEVFAGCPNNGFLTYSQLYYDSPLDCLSCHPSCVTCTTSNYSFSLTDEYSCLTCGALKYFEENQVGLSIGQCKCYPGLEVNNVTEQCIPCASNCFGFTVNFLRSSTKSEFLLVFSSIADLLIPMTQNLKIYINSTESATFTAQQMKSNFYKIVVASENLTACNSKCVVIFEFQKPWKVLKKDKNQALSSTQQSLEIENYYVVEDKIPEELNQAFTISTMLVGAAAGGGLSSMLKMLFQLEQMIEFHKYLNIEMPLIFKQFIQSLSIFKFLDITTVFPFDIDQVLQSLSTMELDTKGPIKVVYYENGANFYKNIIPVVVSFAMVLAINFVLCMVFRLIPCKIFWKLSQKLKVRALITFSDLVQTLIIPVMVFAHFQLSVVYYRKDLIWIYAMTMSMVFLILFIPFYIIAHVYMNQHNKEMKEVYEDLLLDCHIDTPTTYAFFIVSYYRKVVFGLSLLNFIPGIVQGYCVIVVNGIYLGFILLVVGQKIFNSKLKMLTKTLNVLCVIGIEGIMLYYNFKAHPIELMLDLGASCVYLAIIATITGVCQALIKLFQIISQNVKDIQFSRRVSKEADLKTLSKLQKKQSNLEKAFVNPIYCGLGKDSFIPYNSKDSIQTASFETKDKGKASIFNRAKKKLGFLAKLNKNSQDKAKPSTDKQQQSFEQIMQKIDGNDFGGMDSIDDLGYSIRKKEYTKKRDNQGNNKVQRMKSLIQEQKKVQEKPKPSKQNVDDEIKKIQERMRLKNKNLQKKVSLPARSPNQRDFETIDQDNPRYQRQSQIRRENTMNEPITERVKNQDKDEKMMENINEKKTARRRGSKPSDSLQIKQNNKKRQYLEDQDEDIYYVR